MTAVRRAQAAGVQKVPRHEVAGGLAPGRADRYGYFIFATVGKLGAMRTRGDLDGCAEGSLEACNGPRLSSERGENCVSASLSMVRATLTRADGHACMPTNQEECRRHLGGRAECINGQLVD
jgi:hypothetical protein